MNLGSILTGGVIEGVGKIIDDLHTSDEERQAAELESRKLDNQLSMGQIETNKAEAQHASVFVAGWRPYIGWICGTALGLVYIPKAIVMAAIWTYAAVRVVWAWNGMAPFPDLPPYPDLGVMDLIGLISALLGMGGMRMAETLQGKARSDPLTPFQLPNPFRRKPQLAGEPEAP